MSGKIQIYDNVILAEKFLIFTEEVFK